MKKNQYAGRQKLKIKTAILYQGFIKRRFYYSYSIQLIFQQR